MQSYTNEQSKATPYLSRLLVKYIPGILSSDGVAVPDDPEEMRWRLFFAHSQDMYGFRADIFTGGQNEADNPFFPEYKGLRDRWPDAKSMMEGLAAVWINPTAQKALREASNPFRAKELKSLGIKPALDLLRGPCGNAASIVFADTFDELKGSKIAHKTNSIVRSYCQNSALLAKFKYCFRTYLYNALPAGATFPASDVTTVEMIWRDKIERDFFNVGPALAPYMIADWLLWLWRDGQIKWFDSYKPDSVWLASLANCTELGKSILAPEVASSPAAFIEYCKTLRLAKDMIPAHLVRLATSGLPPWLVNEVIWLEESATGPKIG